VQKFIVSTANAYTREEPNMQIKQQYMDQRQHQQQQAHQDSRQHQQHQQQQKTDPAVGDIPQMLSDVLAGSIRSQEDQFADLHNRIQIINHRVNEISDLLYRIIGDNDQRFNDLMHRIVPIDERTNMMIRTVEKIDRTSAEVQRDLESKDFKDVLNTVHSAIENSHNTLNAQIPLAMSHSKLLPLQQCYTFTVLTLDSCWQGTSQHDDLLVRRSCSPSHGCWSLHGIQVPKEGCSQEVPMRSNRPGNVTSMLIS
jgi:mannose-binding lectin 1